MNKSICQCFFEKKKIKSCAHRFSDSGDAAASLQKK